MIARPTMRGGPKAWVAPALVFLLYLAVLTPLTKDAPLSANDKARMAEIEAIVERHSLPIEDSVYADSHDKIFFNGHYYSNKPPSLSLLGAAVYAAQRRVFGWSFRSHPHLVYRWITLLTVGLVSAGLMATFFLALRRWGLSPRARLLITGVAGFSTLLLPYSTVFNNHTVTAALLFWALTLLIGARLDDRPPGPRLGAAGLLLGIALAMDIIAGGAFLAAGAVYVLAQRELRRSWPWFAAAGMLPLIPFFAFNLNFFGRLIPPYADASFYQYPGSALSTPEKVFGAPPELNPMRLLSRIKDVFFRNHGYLSFMPVLYAPLMGLAQCLGVRSRFRPEAMLVAGGALLTAGFYVVKMIGPSGGYGFRYLVALVPVLLFFAPAALRAGGRAGRILFLIAAVYSTGVALFGVVHPWRGLDLRDDVVRAYFNVNYVLLAAYAAFAFWRLTLSIVSAVPPRDRQKQPT